MIILTGADVAELHKLTIPVAVLVQGARQEPFFSDSAYQVCQWLGAAAAVAHVYTNDLISALVRWFVWKSIFEGRFGSPYVCWTDAVVHIMIVHNSAHTFSPFVQGLLTHGVAQQFGGNLPIFQSTSQHAYLWELPEETLMCTMY